MKLRYISKQTRRYMSIGREFPNKDADKNEIELEDNIGKMLLLERSGSMSLWEEVKTRRKSVEENKEEESCQKEQA